MVIIVLECIGFTKNSGIQIGFKRLYSKSKYNNFIPITLILMELSKITKKFKG